MLFFCECLNVIGKLNAGKARRGSFKINASPSMSLEALEFFKSVNLVEGEVSTQHDALVLTLKSDGWNIKHCINCDSHVYASRQNGGGSELLVNANLIRDQAQLMNLMNCDKYSMPFKIILKPIDALPRTLLMSDDSRVTSLFSRLQDYIDALSRQTETEIRKLTMESNARRQQAEKDFERIAALIESTSISTKALSSDSIELTPPVTPESISDKMMTIDNQPQLPHPMKRDGSAKHTSAINQQHMTRAIDFDEDIFDFDGMQTEAVNGTERYDKYSDTEDGSDDEQSDKQRAYMRNRSGSINVARSAPISMPMFSQLTHTIDTEDEKNEQHEMDIASSIQMLARSVHVDSIFGELPARPILRNNTDF